MAAGDAQAATPLAAGGLKPQPRPAENWGVGELPVVVAGLAFAAWGQLLLREAPRVVAAWARLDNLFPPTMRSSPTFAGYTLLLMGAMLSLLPLLG